MLLLDAVNMNTDNTPSVLFCKAGGVVAVQAYWSAYATTGVNATLRVYATLDDTDADLKTTLRETEIIDSSNVGNCVLWFISVARSCQIGVDYISNDANAGNLTVYVVGAENA